MDKLASLKKFTDKTITSTLRTHRSLFGFNRGGRG